jgi:hypothetical protein
MEMIPFLLGLFGIGAAVSGAFAKSYGRSFWLWAFVGAMVPGISLLVLYWLTGRDEERAKRQQAID